MAKNRIEAGNIEKRLGRAASSGGSSREPDEPRPGEASSGGNTLFAFSLVAVFIVGAGALAASDRGAGFRQSVWEDIMGPPAEPAFQSRVAHLCDKGWKDDRLNRDQIHCYMTESVVRLCDPRERRALAEDTHRPIATLTYTDAAVVGLWQCLALIPGFSRSGATMAGGYIAGLDHEDAGRFSFLTATPIILGAAVLEAPKLIKHHDKFSTVAIIAGAVAGVVAFLSTVVLMRWLRSSEVRRFDPFAIYCVLAGAGAVAWLLLRH